MLFMVIETFGPDPKAVYRRFREKGDDYSAILSTVVDGVVMEAEARFVEAPPTVEHVQDRELMMAGSVLTVLPVMVAFVALQRYYIEGITVGSVKG